jgi:4-hydroxythreonine-4-phosphate dehydrogenase
MIYVSQGHQHSIGLEIFLKSWMSLSKSEQKEFTLVANKQSIINTLNSLKVNYEIDDQVLTLFQQPLLYININAKEYSESLTSLLYILNIIRPVDILLTLPTSKDQFLWNQIEHKGHTEFFRYFYQTKEITMSFKTFDQQISLMTDHLPLSEVSQYLTKDLISDKLRNILLFCKTHLPHISEFIFSGINPHAGEGGLLGIEDSIVSMAIEDLHRDYSQYKFTGPISGDALHTLEHPNSYSIYMHHDQALARFKSINGFSGINISLGLPFIRVSVDHGTAFSLYKKNSANYNGAIYTLNQSLFFHRNINNEKK